MHTKLVRLLTSSLHATPIINCCRGSKDFIEKLRAKRKACTLKFDGKYSEGAFFFYSFKVRLACGFGIHHNHILCCGWGQIMPFIYWCSLIPVSKTLFPIVQREFTSMGISANTDTSRCPHPTLEETTTDVLIKLLKYTLLQKYTQ